MPGAKLNFAPGIVESVGSSYRVVTLRVNASLRSASSRLVLTKIDGKDARSLTDSLTGKFPPGREAKLTLDLSPEGGWWGDLSVPVPNGAKAVSLQFAEYKGRTVEFVVAPPGAK